MAHDLMETGGNASAHHDTQHADHQRQVTATDAGSEAAWNLVGKPSAPLTAAQLNAKGVQLGRVANTRDDAEADPAAFVKAFFDSIDLAISDLAYDRRNGDVL